MTSYKKRAKSVFEVLNTMTNIKCNEIEGAMYAFPTINLSQSAIEEAKKHNNMSPDTFYCYNLLLKTGIVVVPGSGFG